ncbi:GIY-YIG nuclease family protein [Verrucomicrobia bacterium S94]|nr:GIY-YIG nuclease family protein [Verrucomicrobia bacterium S94]
MGQAKNQFTEEDDALLGALGVDVEAKKKTRYTKEEERVIAGFEEIQRFVEESGHPPQHGEDRDIFERLYAVRLDRLKELKKFHTLLLPMDHQGLLSAKKECPEEPLDKLNDDELLEALGVETPVGSIQQLKHVRSSREIRAAEEIAGREKCEEFDAFKPLFEQVREELKADMRQMIRCNDKTDVKVGDWFVVDGLTAYIESEGEAFITGEGREDRRLRVIFSNGTESGMLRRSFQKLLWEDDTARRIVIPADMGPLFGDRVCEEDQATGVVYVLRSQSKLPYIVENRELIHKIGFTTGSVEKRIADAANQATYLLAEVEVVATFALYNVNAGKLENVFHKLFSPARLDIEIKDRFGKPFRPREWFLVPLHIIKEAVDKVIDGTVGDYKYDPRKAELIMN